MSAKLEKAFEHYAGLGSARSYRAVAEHFGTSLRSVTKCAARERWRERLREVERRAQAASDERLIAMEVERRVEEYRKIIEVQGRAIAALEARPITSVSDAIEVLDIAMRFEKACLERKHTHMKSTAEWFLRTAVATNGSGA